MEQKNLKISVTSKDEQVILKFSEKVAWITLNVEDALKINESIAKQINYILTEQKEK